MWHVVDCVVYYAKLKLPSFYLSIRCIAVLNGLLPDPAMRLMALEGEFIVTEEQSNE